MRRSLPGTALGLLLVACGGTFPAQTTLGPAPELRTRYIDNATGGYVVCDNAVGAVSQNLNILVIEFSTQGTPSVGVELQGQTGGETSYFLIGDLRRSSRGNFLADVVTNKLVASSVRPLGVVPQYQYVNTVGERRGSVRARLTLPIPTGELTASTGTVDVYGTCVVTGNADSRD